MAAVGVGKLLMDLKDVGEIELRPLGSGVAIAVDVAETEGVTINTLQKQLVETRDSIIALAADRLRTSPLRLFFTSHVNCSAKVSSGQRLVEHVPLVLKIVVRL